MHVCLQTHESFFKLDSVTEQRPLNVCHPAVSCGTQEGKELCVKAGASCIVWLEGYTVQVSIVSLSFEVHVDDRITKGVRDTICLHSAVVGISCGIDPAIWTT